MCGNLDGHPTKNATSHERLDASFAEILRWRHLIDTNKVTPMFTKVVWALLRFMIIYNTCVISTYMHECYQKVKLLGLEVSYTSDHHPIAADIDGYLCKTCFREKD